MCGIAGFWAAPGVHDEAAATAVVTRMADEVRHRGPDDSSTWSDPATGIALGHRRLAIVDLSPTGRQPMTSASGRYVICFNGEIYNHRAIRERLDVELRGTSDTEVFLADIEARGLEAALAGAVGMFAFALVDRRERTLTLVRDRMGEKPLYYGRLGGALLFGSELDAIRAYPGVSPSVDRDALGDLLTVGYIPPPRSIYAGIGKLPAGQLVRFASHDSESRPQTYWSLAAVAASGSRQRFAGDSRQASEALEQQLRVAIRDQMVADVPVGAFLSGGIDSSALVALMQDESSRAIRTFTVGFDDARHDESSHARRVAAHLGTEHTEMRVGSREAMELVPRLAEIFDEPMADYSQVPTYLVAKLTREHVTVSVSADGGDELFGGYNTYRWVQRLRSLTARLPGPALSHTARVARLTSGPLDLLGRHHIAARAGRVAPLLEARSTEATFRALTRHWSPIPLIGGTAHDDPRASPPSGLSDLALMRTLDASSYLPDDVLVKVDRATMAVSLEARAPLLDHRVVELAWTMPDRCLYQRGRGKLPLRDLLYRHVPREIVDRPKMGFSPPMATWLRGPLRPWAEGLLDEARLRREGFLDPRAVRSAWEEHLAGRRDHKFLLWDVLSFQAWLEARGCV
ncbi:MAG: asparagine synthase (glutamine-hydrolyzing) [Sandaracinaceae bacterium]